jgi:type VI secretion system secreted protein Hcp
MNTVWYVLAAALVGLGTPPVLAGQETLVPRLTSGLSMTIEGQMQGVISGKAGILGSRFSHGMKSPRDAASGLATGKRQHLPVTYTKTVGLASPQLMSALARNELLKSVVVSVPGADGGPGYIIKLSNANVSEIKQYTEVVNGRATVLEDVSFTYQKIEVQDLGTGVVAVDDWSSPAS